MNKIPLVIPLTLALILFFVGTLFSPTIRLLPFSPFLALVFRRQNFLTSLWIALFCGLLVDLFTLDVPFGLFSLAYLITAGVLYRLHPLFFEEKPLSLFLFISLISSLLSFTQFFLITSFYKAIPMSFNLILTSFVVMPLVDALFAFFWMIGPLMMYTHIFKGKS